MEAKDGSFGFDFFGTYDEVIPLEKIDYTLGDGRKVNITFKAQGKQRKWLSLLMLKVRIQLRCNSKDGKPF